MDRKRKKADIVMVPVLLIIVIGGFMFWKNFYVKHQVEFNTVDETFYNPLMGFAVKAGNEDAVGDNTLVYVDITWREWEPAQGEYDVEAVIEDNSWYRWKSEGKNVVLRFICDKPDEEEHMDIPDWLYDQTGDGIFYDMEYGKGYAPDYNNELFIEEHRKAILKLGEVFGQDNFVSYIELGSLGHWGEWHMNYTKGTTRIPKENIRKQYVIPYVEAFPNALILARRPFPETAELGMGVFNDMTGAPEDTEEWLGWIAVGGNYDQPVVEEELTAQPEVWLQSPVGGEFTSSITWDEMLETELERTVDMLKQSHMTFIGPKCPVLDEVEEYNKGVTEVLKNVGYRYRIDNAGIAYWKKNSTGKITLSISNIGVAPIYFPWEMWMYICDSDNNTVQKMLVPVELTEICGGMSVEVMLENVPVGPGYSYYVGIENPDTGVPSVYMDMDCINVDKKYLIFVLE